VTRLRKRVDALELQVRQLRRRFLYSFVIVYLSVAAVLHSCGLGAK
jgi:hypothetical protein